MAGNVLFQHPEHQPEGVSLDCILLRGLVVTIQRMVRRARQRRQAITIQRMMRGVYVRILRIRWLLFDHRLMRHRAGFHSVYVPYWFAEFNRRALRLFPT